MLMGCTGISQCSNEPAESPEESPAKERQEKQVKPVRPEKTESEPSRPSGGKAAKSATFWLGADISWATGMEQRGESLYGFEGDEPMECSALMKSLGLNALRFRVWVDPDVVGVCSSKFKTVVCCEAEGSNVLSDEKFSLFVNGVEKEERGTNTEWLAINRTFAAGELRAGWNDIELKSARYTTCRWPVAYYRFETGLPRAFSLPPPGMRIIVR